LNDCRYDRLAAFVGDVAKIFENCKLFNRPDSSVAKCAVGLEAFFSQKLVLLREKIAANMAKRP